MKRTLLSLFFTCAIAAIPTQGTVIEKVSASEAMVYICVRENSKRYHCDRDCRGLNRCDHTIRKVTVSKAKSLGRTPCKVCY